jgi:hypothetical protein
MPHKISEAIQRAVRQRANFQCEYCHVSEKWQYVSFTIEHVLPAAMGGENNLENLALCCFACNRRKSNKTKALDPITRRLVRLFNPRTQKWSEHFIWSEDKVHIVGLTAAGRATIRRLDLNRDRLVKIRLADLEVQRHPPESDPTT